MLNVGIFIFLLKICLGGKLKLKNVIYFLKKKYELIIPILHFIITFMWQEKAFIGFGNWDYFYTIVRNENVISNADELHLVYLLSRIFCFLIIFGFWKIVFFVMKKKASRSDIIILGSILIIVLLVGLILYPNIFGMDLDNYTNYLMARRFQPTYWQSIYTGALYGGCLMVIPHPIAIFIVQWIFFWSVISYIYINMGNLIKNSSWKYCSLLLFLLPESYFLTFSAYRNNFYTVLILFYISQIYFCFKNKISKINIKNIIKFSALTAFIMVWRSEGILIGLGGIAVYLILIFKSIKPKLNKKIFKSIAFLILSVCVLFNTFNQIQAIGAKKYYGKDYMILNTIPVFRSLFNDPNIDLSYEGAKEDLGAIDAIVPIKVLREYSENGMFSYRCYNWTNGRQDFNQTLATDEQANAYMSAYFRIISHNLSSYLNVQIKAFYEALQLPTNRSIYLYNASTKTPDIFNSYSYNSEQLKNIKQLEYTLWMDGLKEIKQTWKTTSWENNKIRIMLMSILNEIINVWREFISNSGLNTILHVASLIMVILLLIKELLDVINKKKQLKNSFPFIFAFLTILGECALILLFMPENKPTYLYPVLYASYLMIYIFFTERFRIKKT